MTWHFRLLSALLLGCFVSIHVLYAIETEPVPTAHWVALWHDAWPSMDPNQNDPEHISGNVLVDRTTGDTYLSMWTHGVWKSSDGGKTFARVDAGVIGNPGCGPIQGHASYIAPNGKSIVTFNMNNQPGASGYSLDGGATWERFEAVGRNWDFGAMDFESKTVIAARHEDEGVHLSSDGGKTWSRLARNRSGVQGLGAIGKILLLSAERGIERSEDNGATWSSVSEEHGNGPALVLAGKLWWLSTRQNCLIVSSDEGKSWQVQGAPVPAAVLQTPLFGKDVNHVVVVTKAGFYESLDGGKSWTLAVNLPPDYVLWNAAFDPVHDVFYITTWVGPVMKYARGGSAEKAPPVVAIADPAGDSAHPKARFVDDARAKIRVLASNAIAYHGDFLYQCGEDGLLYFKRDLQTGKLQVKEQLTELKSGGFTIACAGDRLYGVTAHDGYHRAKWHGLGLFEFDASGKPVRKGLVACPASRQMIVGPGEKDLYLKTCGGKADTLLWFHLEADGKPVKSGEVTGKGLGVSNRCDYDGIIQMTADGRHLYSISSQDYAIACIERKPEGDIHYASAIELDPIANNDPANYAHRWVAVAVSADGKWVYASIRTGRPADNVYGTFARDLSSGQLTFKESIHGDVDPLANQKGWTTVFSPSGKGGYLGSFGALMTFSYDLLNGHLSDPRVVAETKGKNTAILRYDTEHGFLYVASREYEYERFCVFEADRK